jgi:hypothetical protein
MEKEHGVECRRCTRGSEQNAPAVSTLHPQPLYLQPQAKREMKREIVRERERKKEREGGGERARE